MSSIIISERTDYLPEQQYWPTVFPISHFKLWLTKWHLEICVFTEILYS